MTDADLAEPGDEQLSASDTEISAVFAALKRQEDEHERQYESYAASSSYVGDLQSAFVVRSERESFLVGQLVQWKRFQRNLQYPTYGNPVIIVELLDEPLKVDSNGKALLEPLDLIFGYLDYDQDFVLTAGVSHRFTAWEP